MRTIKNLAIPQNADPRFPFSTILNETEVSDGTPVIEEVYGDILTNVYKILQVAGIVPTGTQDSDITQYQILEAIQKLPNVINDIEHSLLLTDTVWSVPLKLQPLPNKFVFFARASAAFNPAVDYTFIGNDSPTISYAISCPSGFSSGDELMVVIDQSAVRVYPLSASSSSVASPDSLISIALGSPLQYNNSQTVYTFENGNLYSNSPTVATIESTLKTFTSDLSLMVLQVFVVRGRLLCFCTNSSENYRFYQFELSDLTSPVLVGYEIPDGTNYMPYCYTDGTSIFISNNGNDTSDDFILRKLNYFPTVPEMSNNSTITLENTFVKTTNGVMKPNALITLINGYLTSFSLVDESKTLLGVYDKAIGNLFYFKTSYYFGSGDIASKWLL
jgi:hypothetical protein